MEKRKVLNIAIGLVVFAALLIVLLAAFTSNPAPPAPPVAAQPTSQPKITTKLPPTAAPATVTPTSQPVTTTAAATNTPGVTLTPTVVPVVTPTWGGFPTITNGPQYPSKFAEQGLFIKPVAGTPIVSRDDALRAMLNRGEQTTLTIVSDHQIVVNGQSILYTAYYGLVTDGYRGPNGLWAGGNLNVPVSKCTVDGKCVPTGEVLDHLENRPMWVVDLQITVQPSMPTCPPVGTPCPRYPLPNHSVNLIDAQTLMFFGGIIYYQP